MIAALATVAFAYDAYKRTQVVETEQEEIIVEQVVTSTPEDVTEEEQEATEDERTIEEKIRGGALYEPVSTEEFAALDECSQKQLRNSATSTTKVVLYADETSNVTVYATPNTEKYTLDDFMNLELDCGELGTLTQYGLLVDGGFQLWFSQLGCGYEIGAAYGNETEDSKACESVNTEVMNLRPVNF